MASAASVSESMQMSMALQALQDGQPWPLGGRPPQKTLGYCRQVLLVLTASGMEMCMTFEQIYQVLILQYLGVPLSLVSLNGVICGLTSMAVIPAVGFVTDRGSNPKVMLHERTRCLEANDWMLPIIFFPVFLSLKRKMISLFVGMAFFQIGILILLVSGIVKTSVLKAALHHLDILPTLPSPPARHTPDAADDYNKSLVINVTNQNESIDDWTQANETTRLIESDTNVGAELPATAYLAICGFAFVDIGFDSTMPISRAYILESVPKLQHVRLLVMTTLVQAVSGTIFSLLGVFDISDALGQAFQVDGTAAVLIFLCTLLFIAVTCGFLSTTLTGYCITKDPTYTNLGPPRANTTSRRTPEIPRRKRLRSYRPHIHRADSTDASKSALLHDDNPASSYAAINKISAFTSSNVSFEEDSKPRRMTDSNNSHQSISVDGKPLGNSRQSAYSTAVPELDESNFHDSLVVSHNLEKSDPTTDFKSTMEATNMAKGVPNSQPPPTEDGVKSKMIKRLFILSASIFFTFGASISFVYYAANAMTLGIIHGDPRALPGTEGKRLYDAGLRTAALGNLSFYILFTITSVINHKLIEVAGEKVLFIVFHLVFIVPLIALVSTPCLEAYFVTIVMVGVLRQAVYTLPFVMANKITQEAGDNKTPDGGKSNLGKTMSLIGFLIPAHYIIISAIMGPVLEATGNVWVPLMYSLGCACLSVLIFCLMFLVK